MSKRRAYCPLSHTISAVDVYFPVMIVKSHAHTHTHTHSSSQAAETKTKSKAPTHTQTSSESNEKEKEKKDTPVQHITTNTEKSDIGDTDKKPTVDNTTAVKDDSKQASSPSSPSDTVVTRKLSISTLSDTSWTTFCREETPRVCFLTHLMSWLCMCVCVCVCVCVYVCMCFFYWDYYCMYVCVL